MVTGPGIHFVTSNMNELRSSGEKFDAMLIQEQNMNGRELHKYSANKCLFIGNFPVI